MTTQCARLWRRLTVLAAVTILVAAACGSDDAEEAATPVAPAAETTEATTAATTEATTDTTAAPAPEAPSGPQSGGSLTFARFFETQSLDPWGWPTTVPSS